MPHKRAKRSVRVKLQNQAGNDLAPGKQSISIEAIPKSASRVLNAVNVRAEYAARKRKREEEESQNSNGVKKQKHEGKKRTEGDEQGGKAPKDAKDGKAMKIQPGESLQHFAQRVEDDMRPLVKSAMRTSLAVSRRARKTELEPKAQKQQQKFGKEKKTVVKQDDSDDESKTLKPVQEKHANRPKEFQTLKTSAPRRLNDIAQAPPTIKRLPRGADKTAKSGSGSHDGVVSMAQKVMMEEEREKAIARYRSLRANQRQQAGQLEG